MYGALEVSRPGKVLGGAEQHRRVPVMTAGVHLAVGGRAMGELVQLLDRQRIHIGAQPDRRRRVAASDGTDDPGSGEPAMHLDAVFGELGGDEIGSALLGKGQFGMGVDVAADRRQFVQIIGDFGEDRHRGSRVPETSILPIVDGRVSTIGPRGVIAAANRG